MRANYFRKKWIYTEQNVLLVLRFRREAKLNAVKTLQVDSENAKIQFNIQQEQTTFYKVIFCT